MKIIASDAAQHAVEEETFKRLEEEFRDSWRAYRGFTISDSKGPMELDLVMVTHDRVVLIEVKHWNGKLTSSDGNWYIDDQIRGRSPVHRKRDHASRLMAILKEELQHALGYFPFVEARVLLCGTSTTEHLPPREKRCAHRLEDFLKIREAQGYEAILGEQQVRFDEKRLRPNSPENLKHFDEFFTHRHIAQENAQQKNQTAAPEALSQ